MPRGVSLLIMSNSGEGRGARCELYYAEHRRPRRDTMKDCSLLRPGGRGEGYQSLESQKQRISESKSTESPLTSLHSHIDIDGLTDGFRTHIQSFKICIPQLVRRQIHQTGCCLRPDEGLRKARNSLRPVYEQPRRRSPGVCVRCGDRAGWWSPV